ncbi:MAG: M23 family metallopeptidase [Rikenellaceae bacterium]|nr:M23 family metallopeptidase [Rikenellaceae bacterium]
MKHLDKINSWFGGVFRKRRISLLDNTEEQWHAELSPASLTAIGVAVVTLVFGILLILVAYTPILDLMPGYRTNAGRSREMLIRSIVRIDSLERKMNDMLTYNENRILVVSGKTPAMQSVKNDSLQRNKSFVAPSKADSLLRKKIENDERYRLNEAKPKSAIQNSLNAVSPMYGLISERFNTKGLLGVRINGTRDAQVSAIADGVVVLSDWSPEVGYSVVIQHKDNYLSVYRHLSGVLLSKGERVQSAQAIGYAGSDNKEELSMLEFELWRDGKAVNPELYIIF